MFTSAVPRLVGNGSVGGGGDDTRSAKAAFSILLQLSFTGDDVDALEQSLFPPSLSILSCLESFLQATKTLTEDSRRCARLLVSGWCGCLLQLRRRGASRCQRCSCSLHATRHVQQLRGAAVCSRALCELPR